MLLGNCNWNNTLLISCSVAIVLVAYTGLAQSAQGGQSPVYADTRPTVGKPKTNYQGEECGKKSNDKDLKARLWKEMGNPFDFMDGGEAWGGQWAALRDAKGNTIWARPIPAPPANVFPAPKSK